MDWIYTVLMIVVLLALLFIFYHFRMNAATDKVVRIMKRCNAISEENAQSQEELRLIPRSITGEMIWGRDYTDEAIMELQKKEIVRRRPDGKLYLIQENLANSKWKHI